MAERKKKLNSDEIFARAFEPFLFFSFSLSFSESVFITGSQPKALAATSDNTVFVVGVNDTVEAVRNNQKVAELRQSGGASASATAIAAAGSLIAIGFGVGPRMPGCLLTPRAFLSLLFIHHQ